MATAPSGLAELEHQGRPRAARGMSSREVTVEGVSSALLVVVAVALGVLGDGGSWRWPEAIALILAFAVALRAQFDVGTGYVPPTQLVFVPALLLEPAQFAPLIALAGWGLGRLPDIAAGRMHASRLLMVPGNCWFAIGPALVLTIAGSHGPDWGDWPIYTLALVSQFAGDLTSIRIRDRLIDDVPAALELRVLAYVWGVDLALAPVGLLAAFASEDARFAFLGVLPLAVLLAVFSNERTRRFEAELAGTRAREALIAGASHELQTPLAVLSGLVDTLARTPLVSEERRRESYAAMARQTAHLRHLVGQFVDYARLKAGQELLVSPRPTDVAPALRAVAELWHQGDVAIEVQAEEVSALVDPARLTRIVMSLVANAVKHGPAQGPVRLTARRDGRRAVIEVADRGPGLPEDRLEEVFDEFAAAGERSEGTGVGLFLARTALRAQGGDVRLRNDPAGGLVATVYLPVTPR